MKIYDHERVQTMKLFGGDKKQDCNHYGFVDFWQSKKGFHGCHVTTSFFKTNGLKYPKLQLMAKNILAIPISTVASRRLLAQVVD
ncbi:hypothetical protein RJ639_027894 [Escallonia herrerae]|uniref:HAT C-terminal dimerisation domain-containing protein n=1 Tax=Escallonia herrerae TaxID=1293975 RepID=A0AA88X7D0_9ASTE|nr:hypothetical protein RJ639_027894 [Escallonia herrerae]